MPSVNLIITKLWHNFWKVTRSLKDKLVLPIYHTNLQVCFIYLRRILKLKGARSIPVSLFKRVLGQRCFLGNFFNFAEKLFSRTPASSYFCQYFLDKFLKICWKHWLQGSWPGNSGIKKTLINPFGDGYQVDK